MEFNEYLVLKAHAREAVTLAERKVQSHLALDKLRHSLEEAKAAIEGNPKPLYKVLRQRILTELGEAEHDSEGRTSPQGAENEGRGC